MQKNIANLLNELGFSEKEAQVFIALLENGSSRASDISKIIDLNRTTIYDIMDSLMKKGVVSKYKKGSATFFSAHDPKQLINYLDREKAEIDKKIEKQKKNVEAVLPDLVSMMNFSKKNRPQVRFYEGEKGMREAYEDTLTSSEPISAFANIKTMNEGLPGFFPEYFERRVKKKIAIRHIAPRNKDTAELEKSNQEHLRETRYLPEVDMSFSPEINFYDNKMLIASWKEKMAIIIESKELVDLMKLSYNILYDRLSKE